MTTPSTGVKPLQMFGLVHKLKRIRRHVKLEARYPLIFAEASMPPGLLAFIRDYFVNLEPFEEAKMDDAKNEDSEEGRFVGGENFV